MALPIPCVRSIHLILITLLIAGLLLWNQVRRQWIGNSKPKNETQHSWEPKSRSLTTLITCHSKTLILKLRLPANKMSLPTDFLPKKKNFFPVLT